jgi:hypothetical protein
MAGPVVAGGEEGINDIFNYFRYLIWLTSEAHVHLSK